MISYFVYQSESGNDIFHTLGGVIVVSYLSQHDFSPLRDLLLYH